MELINDMNFQELNANELLLINGGDWRDFGAHVLGGAGIGAAATKNLYGAIGGAAIGGIVGGIIYYFN